MDLNFFIRGTGTSGDGVLIKLDQVKLDMLGKARR